MAINWGLYNKRLNINGTTSRDRNLQSLQNTLTNKLPDSLSYKAVKLNNVDASIEIVKTTKDYIKVIHSLPNEGFDCGDYVLYNGKTYLITETDADDDVYTSGKMQECTFVLKFQSPTGTILSYPCIDESSNGVGINETDTINTLNSVKRIKLPFCLETDHIKIDDRFFVDRSNKAVYKVTNVNNTEFSLGDKGLIVLTMKSDEIQTTDGIKPKDRPDLGVCNYFEPNIEPEPPVIGYNYATISSSGNLVIGGNTRTITPAFYNADGTLSTETIIPVWTVTLPTGYTSDFTVTYVGNQIKISVVENYDLIDKNVIINVQGNNGGYSGTQTFLITAE